MAITHRLRTVPPIRAWPAGGDRGRAAELDCLRGVLAPGLLDAAARRAGELNIGADQVLIQWGVIDETAYLRRLAAHLDIATESFAAVGRADSPLRDHQIPAAAACGLLPLRTPSGELIWTLAPRLLAARMLCRLLSAYPAIRPRTRLASTASVQQFLMQHGGDALAAAATQTLREKSPAMSAAPAGQHRGRWQRLQRGAAVATLLILLPMAFPGLCGVVAALWFLGFAALRLIASLWPQPPPPHLARLPDDRLPVYTVVAPLYREARSVAALVDAIERLDYPHEKLDVIVVIEPDDLATRAAIARLRPKPHLRVLIAPPAAPRTKPKALNYALAFARGSFIAVFDAEDRPQPGQLRAALDAFRHHGADTACVQASLCIDNVTHSWLSRMFTAEYAGQFDLFLPGMAALGLPLPLGGSSNHFRTAVLRDVGGWDPYNVTEDADLGVRLARLGYRSVTFPSTTFEEAPIGFDAWLRQRSRWMKGWVQTWQVHMRHPIRLWRDLGPRGFVALNLVVGGNVLTALAYPLLLAGTLAALGGSIGVLPAELAPPRPSPLHLVTIAAGYLSTMVVGLLGLARRGQLRRGWVMALTPLYWLCLSLAAWRALAQYVWSPYRWEKTEHGIAARRPPDAAPATDSASDRWRLPRACA